MPIIATAISAIGSAFAAGGIFAAGGALSLVGRFLVTTAISLLGRATADKPRTPGIRNEQTLAGGVNPATFILGRYATGGAAICPEMTYGLINAWGQAPDTPNEYLVYVIDVGDIPGGSGLEHLSIDGVPITLGSVEEYLPALPIYEVGVDPETGYPTAVQIGTVPAVSKGLPGTGAYAGNLWVKFRTGNETTADPYLRRVFADYPERPWTEDMIGVGVPHVILTFRRNPSLFQGYPKCRFVVGGIPLYDWRRDSTVGGSGPQRWSDRATWQSSENPVVQTYNILRGIDFGGVDIWGGKAPADAFRLAEWTVEANKADQLVSLSGGGTEPQFRAGFEVTAFDEPSSIVEELMRGCGGQVADIGGTWRIRIGAPALPVWLFNDDDVIVSSPQDLSPFPGLDATFNAITATFPDPAMDWEPGEAPPRYNALWEALDQNRRLPADLNLPATPYPDQVQRVMRAYIEGERRFASHILTLPPEAGSLEPLDALSWASLGNGYDGKSFELTEIAHDLLGGNVQVSLREVDPADHTWSPSFELPFNRPSSAVVMRPAAHVGGAAVSAETLLDATSAARRPAIKLVWTPVEPGMFQGLEWEMRVAGQSDTRGGTDQAVSAGEMIIVDGILPATAYQLRARWVAHQDVAWTPWLAVTTLDVRIGEADVDDEIGGKLGMAADALIEAQQAADDAAAALLTASNIANSVTADTAAAITAAEAARDLALGAVVSAEQVFADTQALAGDAGAAKLAALAAQTGAETAKTAAETARDLSLTYKDAAAAAKTASELARDNAQTSATGAGNSATAAAGSASTATTKATQAGNSATAAAASVVAAESAQTGAAGAASAASASASAASTSASGAASSASAADAAKIGAVTARSGAESARDTAVTAKNDAQGAAATATTQAGISSTSAFNANASAIAASGSASSASTSATAAGNSATASDAAKTLAQTAKSQAETARTEAVSAKDTAVLSAATASTQAGIATTSATNSGNSATAAAGSASTASTKATEAATSASAANAAKTAAETARSQAITAKNEAVTAKDTAESSAASATTQAGVATSAKMTTVLIEGNPGFEQGYDGWYTSYIGTTPLPESYGTIGPVDGRPMAFQTDMGTRRDISQAKIHYLKTGRKYKARTAIRVSGTGTGAQIYCGIQIVNAAGVPYGLNGGLAYIIISGTTFAPTGAWQDFETLGNIDIAYLVAQKGADAAGFRFIAFLNYATSTTVQVAIDGIWLEDVTESQAAGTSATAAATSASTANTKASEASTSAGAANTAKTAAETARGQAQTYATNASTSATTASGAATTATTQAGLATTAKNDAAGSASAASTSATNAATSATNSGTSAAASNTAKIAAETAKTASEVARNASVTAKTDAQTAATSALTSLDISSRIIGQSSGVLKDQFLGTTAGWGGFVTSPTYVTNTQYPQGRNANWNIAAGVQAGVSVTSSNAAWVGAAGAKGYFIEFEFTLNSGSVGGMGILLDWFNTSSVYARSSMPVADMLTQTVVTGKLMTARGVFVRPASFTGTFSHNHVYLMISYPSEGLGPANAKNVTLHRAFIRPATDEEMGLGVVDATLSQKFMTSAQTNTSIATAITTLQATVTGGLSASVTANKAAIATTNGHLSATAGFKVKAGTSNAELELTALSGAGFSASAARISADNILLDGSVSTKKLIVTGTGAALNSDPFMKDASLYTQTGLSLFNSTTPYNGSGVLRITGVVKTYGLQRIPLDRSKNYKLSFAIRRISGTATFYGVTTFYDRNGVAIAGPTAGWIIGGSNHYFPSNVSPGTDWTEYTTTFGPNETAKIPATAAFVGFGWLGNYAGAAGNIQEVGMISLMEKVSSVLIENGAVTADKLNVSSVSVAGLALFGGELKSSDYLAESSGWSIKNNGDAEFNSLIVRESMIAPNAVSKTFIGNTIAGDLSDLITKYSTVTGVSFSPPVVSGGKIKNPIKYQVSGIVRPQSSGKNMKLRLYTQRRIDSSSTWETADFLTFFELPALFYRFATPFYYQGYSSTMAGFGDESFHLYTEWRLGAVLIKEIGASGYPSFDTGVAEQGSITLTLEQLNK